MRIRVKIIPAVILAIAAFMAILGRDRGSTVDLRLAGMGIPALAHMAAALALAISNNWSLSGGKNTNKYNTIILYYNKNTIKESIN